MKIEKNIYDPEVVQNSFFIKNKIKFIILNKYVSHLLYFKLS